MTSIGSLNSNLRMGQILDEQDHKRCSEGNNRALLAENLDQLRGLVKVLETDNWKYTKSSSSSSPSTFPHPIASVVPVPSDFASSGGTGW